MIFKLSSIMIHTETCIVNFIFKTFSGTFVVQYTTYLLFSVGNWSFSFTLVLNYVHIVHSRYFETFQFVIVIITHANIERTNRYGIPRVQDLYLTRYSLEPCFNLL